MTGALTVLGLTWDRWVTAFFGLTAAWRVVFATFKDLIRVLAPCRFAATAGDLAFDFALRTGLAARTFDAFLARAFPAGERLVAGFRRVDLPATTRLRDDDAADEWREEKRDAGFFTLLAMGLLMRKALDSKTIPHKDQRKNKARA